MGVIEKFMPLVLESEDDGNMAPIIQVKFCMIKHTLSMVPHPGIKVEP